MADILWTGDPATQKYEPWLKKAMGPEGKALPEMINGQICLRFFDHLVRPGEVIVEADASLACPWFVVIPRYNAA